MTLLEAYRSWAEGSNVSPTPYDLLDQMDSTDRAIWEAVGGERAAGDEMDRRGLPRLEYTCPCGASEKPLWPNILDDGFWEDHHRHGFSISAETCKIFETIEGKGPR